MKRRISLLLAVVMVLGSFATVFAETPAVSVEQKSAEFLEKNNILKGNLAGDLELDKNMRRQDSVIMLSRLLGVEEEAQKTEENDAFKKFEDIKDKYYNGFISWALEKEFFVGHTEVRFGYNENITARDYAVVLLRALGYGEEVKGEDGWKAAFAKAKELGLLENVEAKELDEILRGQMAVLTFNALGTKVKGTEKTLAETLAIEMPVPEKLEVEVSANNLKEVRVKFNKDMDRDLVEKVQNYTTEAGNGVSEARLEEDKQTVVLTLTNEMRNNREYKLNIRGIAEEVNKEYKFQVVDNVVPYVVEVVGLGTKGIKVVMSEPVRQPAASLFRLNGSAFYGSVTVVGRDVILKPYSGTFNEGENLLRVGTLTDFANFKSVATEHNFTIVKDTEGPEVVSVIATNDKVIVEFNKAVDVNSVKTDNIFHGDKNTNTANAKKVLSGNRVEYSFTEKPLPTGSVKLTIKGVENYSGVAMKSHTDIYKVNLDETRPEVLSAKYEDQTATIVFSKAMYKDDAEKVENYVMKDKDNVVVKNLIKSVRLTEPQKVVIEFYNTIGSANYTLEITGLRDNTILKNTMLPYSMEIKGGAKADVKLVDVRHEDKNSDYEETERVRIMFNREMDLETVTNPKNFVLYSEGKAYNVSNIQDATIEVSEGGRTITIVMPGNKKTFDTLYITSTLKDINGNTLVAEHVNKDVEFGKVKLEAPKLEGAVANKKNEITLTFSADLASDSNYDGVKIGTVGFKSHKVDGKKLVLTTTKDLSADVKDLEVVIEEKNGIKNLINEVAAKTETAVEVADGIAPTLNTVTVSNTDNIYTFKLKFDEKVVADAGLLNGLVVKKDSTKLNLFDAASLGKVTEETTDEVTVTITFEKAQADGTAFFFNIVENSAAVRDVKANAAKPLTNDIAATIAE